MKSDHPQPSVRSQKDGATSNGPLPWVHLPDEELLKWRMCDLRLQIKGTVLEQRTRQIIQELAGRGINFRPHFWLSDEWFAPDGVPGIAIPFYLAHPRLEQLERKQMLEVEGGTEEWCLQILRHEAGHALDTAYRLHRRKQYQNLFGKYTQPYPVHYFPKPYSKNYVFHLEPAYAQAHPAEDFAETFAVWLKPDADWRVSYEGWPVIKKLEYVDQLMGEIRGREPAVVSRERVETLRTLRKTLGEHYANKRELYGMNMPNLYDQHLRKLFSDAPEHSSQQSAAVFLRRNRAELRRTVAHWTGEYQYTIDKVLQGIIDRCRELNLRLDRPVEQAKLDAMVLVTVQTMNYVHGGYHRVVL